MDKDLCLGIPSAGPESYKPKTSDIYRTCNLPKRFDQPTWFYGYGIQRQPSMHPCYRTNASDYGRQVRGESGSLLRNVQPRLTGMAAGS